MATPPPKTPPPKTNELRRADKERRKRERHPQNGPLMQLNTWLYLHTNAIEDAPDDLLHAANRHLVHRLEAARTQKQNARARKKIRWLAGWCWRVRMELERRSIN